MYTATITNKDFREGTLQVSVAFKKGAETITEAFNVNGADDLNNRIENRLNTLNQLADFVDALELGVWHKPVKEVVVPDPKQLALNKVYEAKGQLDAKLITEEEYDAIVADYKNLSK
jgi:hypothetical protein